MNMNVGYKKFYTEEMDERETSIRLDSATAWCRANNYRTYIYGMGQDVDIFIRFLNKRGIYPVGIVDRDYSKWGKIIMNVSVISPEKFLTENVDYVYIYVFVKEDSPEGKKIREVIEKKKLKGYLYVYTDRFTVGGYLPKHRKMNEGRFGYYKEHSRDLYNVLNFFEDDLSKETFLEYIRAYMECSYYKNISIKNSYKYFFDIDGKCCFRFLEEVWINCGNGYGDTIANFYNNCLVAKKIYAIEGELASIDILKSNLNAGGIKDDIVEILPYNIGTDDDDKCLDYLYNQKEKITLINADIEGCEMKMLEHLSTLIKRDRPVMAICVYHLKEDLVEIPLFLNNILSQYKFVLRKYASPISGDARRCCELVLYAIPYERSF